VATVLAEPLAVVYKHSPICPSSGMAYEVADRVGVVHASPQAIILRAGVAAWHGSHFDLRADTMARRLESIKTGMDTPEEPA
jgi:hypothetical protein